MKIFSKHEANIRRNLMSSATKQIDISSFITIFVFLDAHSKRLFYKNVTMDDW